MHQRVNGNHNHPGFGPQDAALIPRQEETGERHRQHLVRHAVDLGERLDQGLSQPGCSIGPRSEIGVSQALVDPADEIAIGDIPPEQEQAVCRLVEPAVAQIVGRQRASAEMVRFSATLLNLVIPATLIADRFEQPIEQRRVSRWRIAERTPRLARSRESLLINRGSPAIRQPRRTSRLARSSSLGLDLLLERRSPLRAVGGIRRAIVRSR